MIRGCTMALALAALLGCDDGGGVAADAADPADVGPGADAAADVAVDVGAVDAAADGGPADAADAEPPPLVPDELPTAGEPDRPGVADLAQPAAPGVARAGRVDAEGERITGVEASCRLGDFRLDNAVIAVCIQAERSYGQFTFAGGNIVDAVRADRLDGDHFREVIHAPGLGEVSVDRIGIVRDGSDGGPAVIRTEGVAGGALLIQGVLAGSFVPPPVPVVTEFRLAPDSDTVEVLTWLSGAESRARVRLLDLIYFGDQTRPFPPDLLVSEGLPLLAAEGDGVSYGWTSPVGPLGLFPLVGLDLPVLAAQSDQFTLRPGDTVLVRRRLQVGTGDVESVRAAPAGAVAVELSGPPGLRVDVLDADGATVTRAQIAADGTREVMLAPGTYTAQSFRWPGGADAVEVVVGPEGGRATLEPPMPARVTIAVRDEGGAGRVGRVDLNGPGYQRVFVVDERTVELPAGDWTMTTTRGWHWSVDEQGFSVEPGEALRIEVVLEELLPAEGWVSGEFHQHASPSIDSEVPVLDRVLANIAEGVAFMVPSDHDVIYDYAGLVERAGLGDRVAVPLPGVEISPTFTHIGAYGLPYAPHGGAGGAVPLPVLDAGRWRIRTVPELVAEARSRGARLVQINHGRDDAGFFNHTGFAPDVPLAELPAERFTADFDSMEINNRNADTCRLLADWMGLLNQGLRVTAVGNSDSHSTDAPVGYPRNYVPTEAEDPRRVTADEIVAAVQGGRVFVGGGAVMDFPDGRLPGDEVAVDADVLPLRVRVRTPPYAAVDRLLVFVNGELRLEAPVQSDPVELVDFDGVLDVPIDGDAHVVVLALGDDSLAYIRPGRPVFALANPLWVDRDGGGVTPVGPRALAPLELPFCD